MWILELSYTQSHDIKCKSVVSETPLEFFGYMLHKCMSDALEAGVWLCVKLSAL